MALKTTKTSYMKFVTKKGYGFFDASSAFQKAIRRNDENVALYFMVELYNSGFDEYLWKRIKIITSEDVGLAAPSLAATITALYFNYSDIKKDKKDGRPERIFLAHAVIQLCRAKKSRMVDYAIIKYWRQHDSVRVEVPDYAYDQHTGRGKQMGRGLDHFFTEGSFCNNHVEQPFESEYKADALNLRKNQSGPLVFKKEKETNPSLFDINTDDGTEEEI